MNDTEKTKKQLIEELAEVRTREEALRESEERYRSIVESIDIGLNLIDCDHNIVMVNAAQGRHFDKSPHEMAGKSVSGNSKDVMRFAPIVLESRQ